jgi:uncharacterized membrane protein
MQNGKTALGLDNNIGALICYVGNFVCFFGLIYSIIVLVTDKTNKLPRFHAAQSIILMIAYFVSIMAVAIVGGTLVAITQSGILGSLVFLVYGLVILAFLGAIIYSAIQAFQGQVFKLPIVGDLADKFSK